MSATGTTESSLGTQVTYQTIKLFDVVSSPLFVHGFQAAAATFRFFANEPVSNQPSCFVGYAKPPQYNAFSDPSRAKAQFVVLETYWEQPTDRDDEPYGLWFNVKARRLREDGSYDANGELIEFSMFSVGGDYRSNPPLVETVALVKKMRLV